MPVYNLAEHRAKNWLKLCFDSERFLWRYIRTDLAILYCITHLKNCSKI